jgi:hypothetical protein
MNDKDLTDHPGNDGDRRQQQNGHGGGEASLKTLVHAGVELEAG